MQERDAGSVLLRIKPWMQSGGPFEAAGEDAPSFSALDLRDRVVAQLLSKEVVREEQVEAAWHQWNDAEPSGALWRVVARQPGVEAEDVFAEAAGVYAFKSARSILYRSRAFLRSRRGRFSLRQRRHLVTLGVLPVKIDETTGQAPCWVFATHDPARPAVHTLLAELDVPAYELRYAPATPVRTLLAEGFPGAAALEDPDAGDAPERDLPPPGGDEAAQTPSRPAKQGARLPQRKQETTRTFASIYEELLAGAARSEAARVRLAAAPGEGRDDPFVATFEYEERAEPRRVGLAVPPPAVLSFMRRRVRSARRGTFQQQEERTTHRWVEGQRRSFRIGALPERRAWTSGQAAIVIEVAA